jgi:dipeptide/tripeptide permease
MFYAIGQVTLALSSLGRPGTGVHPWTDMVGLLIIALGTGGIKPCVSSFGGDQFQVGFFQNFPVFIF